jgi:hypothetical protein
MPMTSKRSPVRDAAQRDVTLDGGKARAFVDDALRAEVHPRIVLGVEHDAAAQEGVAQVPAGVDRARVDLEVDALDAVLRIHEDRSRRPSETPVLLLDAERCTANRASCGRVDAKRNGSRDCSRRLASAHRRSERLQKDARASTSRLRTNRHRRLALRRSSLRGWSRATCARDAQAPSV